MQTLHQFPVKGNVLVVGCGDGRIGQCLEPHPDEITLIDLNQTMIELAIARSYNQNFKIVCCDFLDYPSDTPFDTIIMPYFLNQLSDQEIEGSLEKAGKLLQASGQLLVYGFTTPTSFLMKIVIQMLLIGNRIYGGVYRDQLPDIPAMARKLNWHIHDEFAASNGYLKGWRFTKN